MARWPARRPLKSRPVRRRLSVRPDDCRCRPARRLVGMGPEHPESGPACLKHAPTKCFAVARGEANKWRLAAVARVLNQPARYHRHRPSEANVILAAWLRPGILADRPFTIDIVSIGLLPASAPRLMRKLISSMASSRNVLASKIKQQARLGWQRGRGHAMKANMPDSDGSAKQGVFPALACAPTRNSGSAMPCANEDAARHRHRPVAVGAGLSSRSAAAQQN